MTALIIEAMPMPPKRKPVARDLNRNIGKRLQRLRKERGLSQVEMARLLGLSQTNVSSYERGEFRLNAEVIIKLARLLKVTADELLGLEDSHRHTTVKDGRFLRYLPLVDDLPQRDRDALLRMFINATTARARARASV